MNINKQNIIVVVVVLIASITFFFVGKSFSGQGKYVEVKGLSERIVKADTAIWSINFEVKSNESIALFQEIDTNIKTLTEFLKSQGFEDSEINIAPPNIYQDTYEGSRYRYNASISMSVYTNKVDLVKSASKATLSLLEKGVVMNGNYINFEFSDLASIKPEMLKEAIAQARVSAQQFAEDSGSSLGVLARANQGVFDISDKDQGSPEYKKIRVVSTLRYLIN